MVPGPAPRQGPLAALRAFARPVPRAERCELCGAGLGSAHPHVVEPAVRRLLCCCDACALLLGCQDGGRYRRVSPRLDLLPGLRMPDSQWASLLVPVNLAFFC